MADTLQPGGRKTLSVFGLDLQIRYLIAAVIVLGIVAVVYAYREKLTSKKRPPKRQKKGKPKTAEDSDSDSDADADAEPAATEKAAISAQKRATAEEVERLIRELKS